MRQKLISTLAALAVIAGAAHFFRYSTTPLERISAVARLDRWTGKVVIIRFDGRELGNYPSFDPIRDGLAEAAK